MCAAGQSDEPWPVHSNWHAVGQLALLCLPLSILAIPWLMCVLLGGLPCFSCCCVERGGGGEAAQRCTHTPVNSPSDQASGLKGRGGGGQWGKLPSTSTYLMSCLMLSSSNLAAGISEGDGLWFGSSMLYPVP